MFVARLSKFVELLDIRLVLVVVIFIVLVFGTVYDCDDDTCVDFERVRLLRLRYILGVFDRGSGAVRVALSEREAVGVLLSETDSQDLECTIELESLNVSVVVVQ